eukprot:5165496-Lingulodinium_polyedra.AAC.1
MDRGINKQGLSTDPFVARITVRARSRRDETASKLLAYGQVGDAQVQNSSSAHAVLAGIGLQGKDKGHPEHKQLLLYWLATRKAFHGATSCHICVDAGRVGNRSWQLGAVQARLGEEDPMVAWAPPQAPLQNDS